MPSAVLCAELCDKLCAKHSAIPVRYSGTVASSPAAREPLLVPRYCKHRLVSNIAWRIAQLQYGEAVTAKIAKPVAVGIAVAVG